MSQQNSITDQKQKLSFCNCSQLSDEFVVLPLGHEHSVYSGVASVAIMSGGCCCAMIHDGFGNKIDVNKVVRFYLGHNSPPILRKPVSSYRSAILQSLQQGSIRGLSWWIPSVEGHLSLKASSV